MYGGVGEGNGCFSLTLGKAVATGSVQDCALIFEGGERFAECYASHAAELTQLFYGHGPFEFCHGLDDAVAGIFLCRSGEGGKGFWQRLAGFDRQSQGRAV